MRFSSLEAWLAWQATASPREVELGLERIGLVWQRLGRPAPDAPVITVAGTNGKGSSVAFAEAILQAAGYRTGCYTSPHLLHYNERIRVDQTDVEDDPICIAFERIDQARGDIPLTYFEFGTLAALLIFADVRLDAVILEVGLGGRLDAVNLIDSHVALITSIGLDHQDWLGTDLEAIGAEKAAIMRPNRPAVFSGRQIPASIRDHARATGTPLAIAGEDYRIVRRPEAWDLIGEATERHALPLPSMRGAMQLDNAAGALFALDCLSATLPIDQRAVRTGLLAARVPGRFDVRPGTPTWVLDVAHNPQAAAVLDDMLGDLFTPGRRIAVLGMLADKDAAGVAAALAGRFDSWYLVDLSAYPRGRKADQLAEAVRPALDRVPVIMGTRIEDTLAQITAESNPDDLVVVFGSFLTVAGAMAWLEQAAAKAVKV
ncbi:MAG: bifunctional tetrahydrofolate synthase/dihydrofolate synthase [Sedimenticolaceae bacterium]